MAEPMKRAGSLDETRAALERWRRTHGGRGKPIPAALWTAAACVARAEGVIATAHALRINPAKLARLVATTAAPARPTSSARACAAPGFVALEGLRVPPNREASVVLELRSASGDSMRVEVTGDAHGLELAALARAFWDREA